MGEQKKEEESSTKVEYNPWYYHQFFQYAFGTLLVLAIIWIFYQVAFLLKPVVDFVSTLFIPIVISMLFYYLLRPVVHYFETYRIPRIVTILCIYIIVALFVVIFIAYIGPLLTKQITALANTSVEAWKKAKETSQSYLFRYFNVRINEEIEQGLFTLAQQITAALSKNLIDLLGFITRLATILVVIPFIVFYLLKDDQDFTSGFLRHVPEDFGREVRRILRNMDTTLANYITGVVLVSSSLGLLLFIGYLIIGLDYALILSLIAIILTTIPFLGPFLAITPAILVGLSDSPFMVLKVVIVFLIVQQCESNIISPQIIGQRLKIHPLTIILLLLAAGSLYGLIGLILATPAYALLKVLIDSVYKIYQLHYSHWK